MLAPGTRLGPDDVTTKLGEGGMGEVYRVRDARLERDGAIRVLPAAAVEDPEQARARRSKEGGAREAFRWCVPSG